MKKLIAVLMFLVVAGLSTTACNTTPVDPAWECDPPWPTPNGWTCP